MAVIAFEGLSKHYGSFTAVRNLAFSVERGEVFGFLGPNGAGKTTTIRMLMGILVPSAGRATIEGLDCQRERTEGKRRVGYLPDTPVFYDFLRGREILEFVGEMHGQSRSTARHNAGKLLDELALGEAAEGHSDVRARSSGSSRLRAHGTAHRPHGRSCALQRCCHRLPIPILRSVVA